MPQKGWIESAALLCVIAAFTVLAAGSQPEPVLIGAFAQYLLPALLTIYLLVVLYNARAIINILASFLLRKRKEEVSRPSSWLAVIGYAIGTSLIILLIRTGAFQKVLGAVENSVAAVSALRLQQGLSSQIGLSSTNPYLLDYAILVFSAIILVSLTLIIGALHTAYSWTREGNTPVGVDRARQETLKVVQRATRDLRMSDDYGETILNCYRQMCSVLSIHGFGIASHETATEFSNSVSGKLGLGGESMRGLTFLFEEARYSNHLIDGKKRAMALSQLESIERSLGSVSG
jgi:hypothetical protein